MVNFHLYLVRTQYAGQCVDCDEQFPNRKTREPDSVYAMRAWRFRHQKKTGHKVRTATTTIREYPGGTTN